MATFESNIEIQVVKFRPIGSLSTTTVAMKLLGGVETPKDSGVFIDCNVVSLVGSYFIKVKKKGDPGVDDDPHMLLTFSVTNHNDNPEPDEYLLQGIAFSNRDPRKQGNLDNRLGQRDFIGVQISGAGTNRKFTVTNSRKHTKKESYDYLFLIQRASDGAIGIIDPEFENEN